MQSKQICAGMLLADAIAIASEASGKSILARHIGDDADGTQRYTLNVWVLDDEVNGARGAGDTLDNPAVMCCREYQLSVVDGVILRFTFLTWRSL